MKKGVQSAGLIAAICLALVGCSPSGPPIQVSAGELYADYLKNAAAADQKYRGRTLIVDGISGGMDSEGSGYVLTLVPGIRAHLRSETVGANLFQKVVVRCDGVALKEGVIDLRGCEIGGETDVASMNEAGTQALTGGSPSKPPSELGVIGSGSPADRLEAAFEAATGRRSAYDILEGTERISIKPLALISLPFGQALLTERRIQDGCHGCPGAIGVYYIAEEQGRMRITGHWPRAVAGEGWGEPPGLWRVTSNFSTNPAIYAEGSFMAQGYGSTYATITELTPNGPVSSDEILIQYSDEGAAVDREPCILHGRIADVRTDRSFEVWITGSAQRTDRYVKRGGRFVAASATDDQEACS